MKHVYLFALSVLATACSQSAANATSNTAETAKSINGTCRVLGDTSSDAEGHQETKRDVSYGATLLDLPALELVSGKPVGGNPRMLIKQKESPYHMEIKQYGGGFAFALIGYHDLETKRRYKFAVLCANGYDVSIEKLFEEFKY